MNPYECNECGGEILEDGICSKCGFLYNLREREDDFNDM